MRRWLNDYALIQLRDGFQPVLWLGTIILNQSPSRQGMKKKKTQTYYQTILSQLQGHYPANEFSIVSQMDKTTRLNTVAQLLAIDQDLQIFNPFVKQSLVKYLKEKSFLE